MRVVFAGTPEVAVPALDEDEHIRARRSHDHVRVLALERVEEEMRDITNRRVRELEVPEPPPRSVLTTA